MWEAREVQIALVQHDIVWESPAENHARLGPRIAEAAAGGARLVLCSEMFATGFSMRTDAVAEDPEGPSWEFLHASAQAHGIWVGGSVAERGDDPRPYNTFVLAAPDGTTVRYRKIHPFTYGREHEHYAAGREHRVVEIDGLRVALFVCYDLRFADEFWVLAPDVDCYAVVANWPASRRHHWRTLLTARAIENQAYVAGVNRVGSAPTLTYAGDSMIVDPSGEILAAAAQVETVVRATVDPAVVARTREEFPFLRDRR